MEKIKTATIAILILILLISYSKCSSYRNAARHVTAIAIGKAHQVTYYRDQYNIEHATAQSEQLDHTQLLTLYHDSLDHLAALLRVKPKQISGITGIGMHTTDTVLVPVDSAGLDAYYSDKYMSMHITPKRDTYMVEYAYDDSITISDYWQRRWLLGRKQYYVNGFAQNPHTHLTGLTGVRLKAKDPGRFGVGPALNIDINGRVSFGLSFTYSIVRF